MSRASRFPTIPNQCNLLLANREGGIYGPWWTFSRLPFPSLKTSSSLGGAALAPEILGWVWRVDTPSL